MSEYDNTNSGALFKNDKDGVDTRPDYRGSINVDGTDYWLSAWLKTGKSGQKFMSLAVKPKDDAPKPAKRVKHNDDTPDSDIPF